MTKKTLPPRFAARRRLWASDLVDADKIVSAAIIEYMGDDNVAWPSQETLAKDCYKSIRSVERSIARLKAAGVFRVTGGTGGRGAYTFNRYILNVDWAQDHPSSVTDDKEQDHPSPVTGDTTDHPSSVARSPVTRDKITRHPWQSHPSSVAKSPVTGDGLIHQEHSIEHATDQSIEQEDASSPSSDPDAEKIKDPVTACPPPETVSRDRADKGGGRAEDRPAAAMWDRGAMERSLTTSRPEDSFKDNEPSGPTWLERTVAAHKGKIAAQDYSDFDF